MFYTVVVVLLLSAFVLLFVWPGILTGGVPFWEWSASSPGVGAELGQSAQLGVEVTPPPRREDVSDSDPVSPTRAEFDLTKGQMAPIKAGTACSGDFDVRWANGEWQSPYLHETDPDDTGQITSFYVDGEVRAAYEGSCFPMEFVDDVKKKMAIDGCESGCRWINPVEIR